MEWNPEEPVLPQPEVPRPQPRRQQTRFHFAQWQVQVMEAVSQETQCQDELTREVLSRTMNVPEVKVKSWFNSRRARQKVIGKKAMLESMPPGAWDHTFMMDIGEP